tara:strand:- start:3029 stop:4249 length:1221 start_codon:yes stop_codon:yes gene_type:complete
MTHPFITKYQPKRIKDIVGQNTAVQNLVDFITNFKAQKKKAVIVHGPSGSGKTSSIYAIADELGLEVMETNASDIRNKEEILQRVGEAVKQRSLFSRGKIILIDEIDGLSGTKDRGGATAIAKLINESFFPIVLTSFNPWNRKLSSLRSKSSLIEFKTLNYLSVFNVLKSICIKEGIKFDELALKGLARRSGGDLRAAINDLQSLTQRSKILDKKLLEELCERNKTEKMFNALIKVFKNSDLKIALEAFDNVEENLDECILWLDENLPKEYENPEDLARAYDMLSKADVFRRRIKRWQHWRFLVYVNTLVTAGIASAKGERSKRFVRYMPTGRILKIWRINQKNLRKKAIAQKIAEHTHSSSKRALKDSFPYIKFILQNSKDMGREISEELELDKEDIGWLKKQTL